MQSSLVFLFDVFGTVFHLTDIDRSEIADYVKTVKAEVWRPLTLPESWRNLVVWGDVHSGLRTLRVAGHTVCTMTNCPVDLLVHLSRENELDWSLIVPIELRQVYKPRPAAYLLACDLLKVEPWQCVMVTANATFGDVEAARALGMRVELINRPEYTIADMAGKYWGVV